MRRTASLLSLIGLIVLPAAARGQEAPARVTVRVQHEGAPVADALVHAGARARVTNGRGEVLLVLPPGPHRLMVAVIGFAPETLAVALRAGGDTTVTFALRESPAELEAVTIMATRGERRLEEEPTRVEVLSGEDVAEKTEMRPSDLRMLLSEMVGVRTQMTGPGLGGAVVRIQGLRGHYSLFLSDGLPLQGSQSGGLSILQLPPLDLLQVEVIKGAASALYGPSALGGVVDLISRRPADGREVVVNQSTRGGSDGFLWMSQRLDGGWGYTLIGDAHHQARRDVSGDGWADFAGFTRAGVRPRVYWSGAGGSTLMATVGAMVEGRDGGTVPGALAPDGQPFPEGLDTRRVDAGTNGRFVLGGGRALRLRASGMTQEHDRREGPARERDHQNLEFAEAAVSGGPGNLEWLVGSSWQREAYRARDVGGMDYTFTTPAGFVQLTATPRPWVTATASGRCDAHNVYGTICSPRLSTLFRLAAAWSLRASVGTGFFAPTPFVEETQAIGLTHLAPPAGLVAERARNGSLDLTAALGPLEVSATLYASRISHAVALRPIPGDTTGGVELVNAAGPSRAFGAETFAVYEREPFVATLHYAYLRATEVDATSGARRDVPLDPRHEVFLDLAYEAIARGTWIALEADWTGRQAVADDPYRGRSRPYLVAGLLVSQRVGRTTVFANVENILDVRQTDTDPLLLPAPGPGGRWTTAQWGPLEGRVFNGGVRLTF